MSTQKIVTTAEQAYSTIQSRLLTDLEPVWQMINHRQYSPFWLLARELFPIAESIGDLIYRDKPTINLTKVLENDFSKIRPEYADKGKMIALLYRHSLIHQDEPRSIYSGNITIEWSLAFIDGRYHLKVSNIDRRRHSCVMQFDLRTFYEDILALLELYKEKGPKRGIASRYNSWTFGNYQDGETVRTVRQFYKSYVDPVS